MRNARAAVRGVALAVLVFAFLAGDISATVVEENADDVETRSIPSTSGEVTEEGATMTSSKDTEPAPPSSSGDDDEANPSPTVALQRTSSTIEDAAPAATPVAAVKPAVTRAPAPRRRRGGAGDDGVAPAMLKNGSPPRSIVLVANGKVSATSTCRARARKYVCI